jgi:hypothetical protein
MDTTVTLTVTPEQLRYAAVALALVLYKVVGSLIGGAVVRHVNYSGHNPNPTVWDAEDRLLGVVSGAFWPVTAALYALGTTLYLAHRPFAPFARMGAAGVQKLGNYLSRKQGG